MLFDRFATIHELIGMSDASLRSTMTKLHNIQDTKHLPVIALEVDSYFMISVILYDDRSLYLLRFAFCIMNQFLEKMKSLD